MTTKQWPLVRRILEDALEKPEAERNLFIEEACGSNNDLRIEVENLLQHESIADSFLKPPINNVAESMIFEADIHQSVGSKIGPYKVSGVIASGGMGTVYHALRADSEYDKDVAIKILTGSLKSSRSTARFHRERQILAKLEHPNITRLIDGGTTQAGRPYIVMEYVKGVPLLRYANEQGLSARERLDLFLQLCQAVQFAHKNLIVHRDIKPANILVTESGEVKLLDFGISKLIVTDGTDLVDPMTITLAAPMTVRYSSPEQVSGSTITTASDIYSLGVVLYELLTGNPPYDAGPSIQEAVESICNTTPALPSTTCEELNSELDAILLHALEKSPSRRYDTADAFMNDIERYLEGRTVLAYPPTRWYIMRKAAWRYRWPLSLVATILVSLIVFGVVVTGFAIKLSHERSVAVKAEKRESLARNKAEQINTFLAETLVSADPLLEGRKDLSILTLLKDASGRLDSELPTDSTARADLHLTIGRAYLNLWLLKDAEPHLVAAVNYFRNIPTDIENLASSLYYLAELRKSQFDNQPAVNLYKESLEARNESEHINQIAVVETLINMAKSTNWNNDYNQSLKILKKALLILQALEPEGGVLAAEAMDLIALTYAYTGEAEKAVKQHALSMQMRYDRIPDAHKSIADGLEFGGWLYDELDNVPKAASQFQEALTLRITSKGINHPSTIETRLHAGVFLIKAVREKEGEELIIKAVTLAEETLPDWHQTLRYSKSYYALYLVEKERYKEAEHYQLAAYKSTVRMFGKEHALTNTVRSNVVKLYEKWGKSEMADQYR